MRWLLIHHGDHYHQTWLIDCKRNVDSHRAIGHTERHGKQQRTWAKALTWQTSGLIIMTGRELPVSRQPAAKHGPVGLARRHGPGHLCDPRALVGTGALGHAQPRAPQPITAAHPENQRPGQPSSSPSSWILRVMVLRPMPSFCAASMRRPPVYARAAWISGTQTAASAHPRPRATRLQQRCGLVLQRLGPVQAQLRLTREPIGATTACAASRTRTPWPLPPASPPQR